MILLCAACAATPTAVVEQPTATLLPLLASPTPTALQATVPAQPTPGPSPTPFTHIVEQGDTLLGIALQYGVELDDLLVANAGVNPRFLSIGQAILIPASADQPVMPTATPVPVALSPVGCYRTLEGSLWCLCLASNPSEAAIEGIGALITLATAVGEPVLSEPAYAPLNLLHPGEAQPLAAHFPPPVPAFELAQIRLTGAVPASDLESRYATVQLDLLQSDPGATAETWVVAGEVRLVNSADLEVHLSVVALDADGRPVGLAKRTLQANPSVSFAITVSSLGPPIDRVEVRAEAPIPQGSQG